MAARHIPFDLTPIDKILIQDRIRTQERVSRMVLRIALARAQVVGRIMAAVEDGMPPLEEVDE